MSSFPTTDNASVCTLSLLSASVGSNWDYFRGESPIGWRSWLFIGTRRKTCYGYISYTNTH